MLTTLRGHYTARDFEQIPEGVRCELINGEIIMAPSPTEAHQSISGELFFLLKLYLRRHQVGRAYCAPLDVYLDNPNAFQPDVLFVANERMSIITSKGVRGAPDLVMEILSPSNAHQDLHDKKDVYAESGVKEYWIVDPFEKTINIFQNIGSEFVSITMARHGDNAESKLLPGFVVELAAVFSSAM